MLKWAGVEEFSDLSDDSVGAIARFSNKIGLSLRETLVHIRITIAEQSGYAPIPLLLAHRRSVESQASELEECELIMEQIESECEPGERKKLSRIISRVYSAYKVEV